MSNHAADPTCPTSPTESNRVEQTEYTTGGVTTAAPTPSPTESTHRSPVDEVDDHNEWERGEAMGVCRCQYAAEKQPIVEAKARANQADLAVTLVHEYAHALLHSGVDAVQERAKREVEAEAVGYVVGRYFGLDTSGSAFYLAAWQDDDLETLQDRLGRISSTAQTIVETVVE